MEGDFDALDVMELLFKENNIKYERCKTTRYDHPDPKKGFKLVFMEGQESKRIYAYVMNHKKQHSTAVFDLQKDGMQVFQTKVADFIAKFTAL